MYHCPWFRFIYYSCSREVIWRFGGSRSEGGRGFNRKYLWRHPESHRCCLPDLIRLSNTCVTPEVKDKPLFRNAKRRTVAIPQNMSRQERRMILQWLLATVARTLLLFTTWCRGGPTLAVGNECLIRRSERGMFMPRKRWIKYWNKTYETFLVYLPKLQASLIEVLADPRLLHCIVEWAANSVKQIRLLLCCWKTSVLAKLCWNPQQHAPTPHGLYPTPLSHPTATDQTYQMSNCSISERLNQETLHVVLLITKKQRESDSCNTPHHPIADHRHPGFVPHTLRSTQCTELRPCYAAQFLQQLATQHRCVASCWRIARCNRVPRQLATHLFLLRATLHEVESSSTFRNNRSNLQLPLHSVTPLQQLETQFSSSVCWFQIYCKSDRPPTPVRQ